MKKYPKRPTVMQCQTKVSCNNDKSSYKCQDCNSYYCELCISSHTSHNTYSLKVVDKNKICVGPCSNTTKNIADIVCNICKKKFCWNCYKSTDSKHFKQNNYIDINAEENEFHTIQFQNIAKQTELFDENEKFKFEDCDTLSKALGINSDDEVMVVSIIGRTGDGKSHLLNQTFFNGLEVFQTDPGQKRCTVGAWIACGELEPFEDQLKTKLLLIDTEGLQGQTDTPLKRQRMLMKVMAVSDLVLYRTKDSRLGQEIFCCIADAWSAFERHFLPQLKTKAALANCNVDKLAPAFMIVHTLEFTNPFGSCEEIIQSIKQERPDCKMNFSELSYIYYQCRDDKSQTVDYKDLRSKIIEQLSGLVFRQARSCRIVFECMNMLNLKFSEEIEPKEDNSVFPDEFFSCTIRCKVCDQRCQLSMSHTGRHLNLHNPCRICHKLENYIFYCKNCYNAKGSETPLIPKPLSSKESIITGTIGYIWRGFVLECDLCGIIYQSREYWYGNENPQDHRNVVQKIVHFWPGEESLVLGGHPITQRWADSLAELSNELASWSGPAMKTVKDGIVDNCLPPYMQPNSKITDCRVCNRPLNTSATDPVHHCRQCTRGVCDVCSNYSINFPKHGLQRVCKICFEESKKDGFRPTVLPEDNGTYQVYKIAQKSSNFIGSIAKTPIALAKWASQPSYWQPDSQCIECFLCKIAFHNHWNPVHHCRSCGKGVCNSCSQHREKVPLRGIDKPQRICDRCFSNQLFEIPTN